MPAQLRSRRLPARAAGVGAFLFAALFVVLGVASARAAVTPNALFRDHAVLQQGMKLPVWGAADAGEEVTVAFAGQTHATRADANGKWRVTLDPLTPSDAPADLTIRGSNQIVVKDVLVGEVWVCSGQSNMGWGVQAARDAEREMAAANYPAIRHFRVEPNVQDSPQSKLGGDWQVCSPSGVAYWSAVAYFFGRDLHQELHAPIGLIHVSTGGSYAEAWTSRETLLADADFRPIVERHNARLLKWGRELEPFARELAAWRPAAEQAAAAGTQPPPFPVASPLAHNPLPEWDMASTMYDGMITAIAPYAIRGVVWYQGESNTDRAWQYRKLLPAMIADWRRLWGQGDFAFLIVQLCNHHPANPQPGDSSWAELREAQLQALAEPNTVITVNIDIGEAKNIHPLNKQDVGHRLALAAERLVYGRNINAYSPLYESVQFDGAQATLRFRNVGGGLMAKGGPLKQFAIAGTDRKFVWADAKIVGDTVVVSSPQTPTPAAVRYAWADNPEGANLYDLDGLPASPFRTDDWPMTTREKR